MTELKNEAVVFIKLKKSKLKQLGYDNTTINLIFVHNLKHMLRYEDLEYRIRQNISCLQCANLEDT